MIVSRPPLRGLPARRVADHAPAAKSRRVLGDFFSFALRKSRSGALILGGRVVGLEEQATPVNYAGGPPLSAGAVGQNAPRGTRSWSLFVRATTQLETTAKKGQVL
jgi:hypothetical protein